MIGTREEVRKAEEIVSNVENQIGGARDKVVFWYTVKHSEAEELADVLYRVYSLMITTGTGFEAPAGGRQALKASKTKLCVDNNGVLGGPPIPPPQKEPPPCSLSARRILSRRGIYC